MMKTTGTNSVLGHSGVILTASLILSLLFVWDAAPVSAATLTPSDCAQCHGANVAAKHHQSDAYVQGLCNQCHEGVTTGGGCADCHTFVPQQNAHHATPEATSGNCAECHTNVGDLADCLDCHKGSIRTPHHLAADNDPRTPAVDPIACATCHTTMEPLAGCSATSCHPGNIRVTHHSSPDANSGNCAACHTGITPVVDCESCHNGAYWTAKNAATPDARSTHHAASGDCVSCHASAPRPTDCHECHQGESAGRHHEMLTGTLTCSNCHSAIALDTRRTNPEKPKAYTGCQNCHAPSEANQTQHHDLAIANPNLTCNTCHSDAGDVPGCATCHDAAYWGVNTAGQQRTARDVHHAFNVAPGTDCTTCHTTMNFDSSCDSCHASGEARLQEHHNPNNPSIPSNLACSLCHGAGSTIPVVNSCQFCHNAGFWQAAGRAGSSRAQHHEVVLGSPGVADCAACHTTLVPQTCATCHDSGFWTTAGRAGSAEAQHHDVVRVAGSGLACADCHAGGLKGENNDCQACHAGEAQAFHHDVVRTDQTSCQECHTALPVAYACETCHTSDSWVTDARTDHHNSLTATTAGSNCATCHSVTPTDNCTNCHTSATWTVDARTDHHEAASGPGGTSCNSCHESIVPTSGCRSCHPGGSSLSGPHHGQLLISDCYKCHDVDGFPPPPPSESRCESCHTTDLPRVIANNSQVTVEISQIHHATPSAVNDNCGLCHQGIADIDPLSLDCATCHANQPPAIKGDLAMHHGKPAYTQGNCASCHQGLVTAQLDCATCHANQPLAINGDPDMHHATPDSDNCVSCHSGAVALDCAGCHIDSTDPTLVPIPERHHNSEFAQAAGRACAECHTGADVVNNNCELCHVGTGQPAISERHHATGSYTSQSCAFCHEGIEGVTGDALDCAVCHADKARNGDTAMHHGTPNGAPNYNDMDRCATCHNARNFEQMIAGNNCNTCHTPPSNPDLIANRHHATTPAVENNCSACHTSVNQAELDCSTCHANQPVKDGKAPMHHMTATATAPDAACTDCHATVDVTNVTCKTCHASQPVLNGGLAMHHATQKFEDGLCMTCHLGADSALLNCAGCHVSSTKPANQMAVRHHNGEFAKLPTTACTDCHTKVSTAALDCALCHAPQAADMNGSVSMHHNLTPAGMMAEAGCATCHVGATVAENACSVCHTGTGEQDLAGKHHATQTAQTGLCSACHVGAEAEGIGCASCHGGDSNHHIQTAYTNGNCTSCHEAITLNGANCEACHAAPGKPSIQATHHGAPLAEKGGDCSACHTAVSSPDVCGNCHSASPHHTTPWSIAGDCAHCHKVPANVQDRPAQAACRECHGSMKHNKGGPVQNFGACAACHNTVPFHPKPSRAPGYTKMVGGKGKFNIFWSAMTNGGSDEIREDVRPNGEDMNDEGGYRYRNPTISFNNYTIEYAGKAYRVPGFSPPANYGSSTSLSVCTSCHVNRSASVSCSNTMWRAHLTLGRVNQATYQLAEATYIGNLCGGTTAPPATTTNLAKNKSASASGSEGGSYQASYAVDGNASSRWYVRSYNQEWLKVDLAQTQRISKVVIKWHSEYAREYEVQVSTNNSTWTRVVNDTNGNGGTDTVTFSARDARYVRVLCNRRQNNGYSIYELEVYQ